MDSITYSYGNETWGDLITYNSQYVTLHDSMGNPIEYISQSSGNAPIDDAYLVWKNGRELASINSKATNTPIASYKYDSSGLRTNKTIGTSDIARYLYDDNGNLISEQRSTYALTFYYDGNGVRTHFTHESEAGRHTYYYRYNLQGDVIALLDSTGTVVAEYNYTPYGEHIGTVTGIAADNPFRYRGYYFDSETGYYYLQSRYYNPYTCRFINSDAILNIDFGGSNLFAYCNNEPINRTDSTGFWFGWDDILTGPVDEIIVLLLLPLVIIIQSYVDGTSALQAPTYDDFDWKIHHNPNPYTGPSTIIDPIPRLSPDDPPQTEAIFYKADLKKPGIKVYLRDSMSVEEAKKYVLKGGNVWTPYEEDALALAIYASGGFENGNFELKVVAGENAFHYHLKDKLAGSHLFFGYQAVDFDH